MKIFVNVASLKLAKLQPGQNVSTQGYYTAGDGGGATYLIVAPQAFDGYGDHELANGNVAVLQEEVISAKQFGAKGGASTDDTASIQAAFNAASSGESVVFHAGKYIITSKLSLAKSIQIVGLGAVRNSNDNSNPEIGVQIVSNITADDMLLIQPPNSTNSRIRVDISNVLFIGNLNYAGATSGRGVVVDGRALAGTAAEVYFTNFGVSEAFTNGLELIDEVYEGALKGVYLTDNGGKGFYARSTGGVPGEYLLEDFHCNDNAGDGIDISGGGHWTIVRASASRNGGAGFKASGVQFESIGLQLESNTGAKTLDLTSIINGSINGLNLNYAAGATNDGMYLASCSGMNLSNLFFGNTTTGDDITFDASSDSNIVSRYIQSAASKVNDLGADNIIWDGRRIRVGNNYIGGFGKNLRGTVQVADASLTGSVTFTTPEPDNAYRLSVTPVNTTGAVSGGSNRPFTVTKSTTGFTLQVEAAPGAGTSVDFDWILIR